MPTVSITHPDGTTDTISETVGWQYKREIGTMDKLMISVDRDDAESITLERQQDEVDLAGVTTGRLVDVETGGSTWRLVVRSFEWDAKTVEPIAGGTRRLGTDEDLLTTLIGDVPSWSVGSTVELTPELTFIFNHAHRHEAMRRIEQNVPGELRWNADQTVDYVQDLGTDKSATLTLSATAGNLNDSIQINERGVELNVTHLRIIGAHEGEAQFVANLVPSGDSGNYANEVTYSQPRWSDSSDTVWGRWENKDIADQATLDEEAGAIAAELTEDLVEATAIVEGEDLSVGDWVQVEKPDADLDRKMRIHRITTRTTPDSVAGTVDEVLLSTRTIARGTEQRRLRDIQRYNVAFQGSAVWGTIGAGIQAVDSGLNYQLPFFYPDVAYEHRVELYVKSIPYRAFSSGAGAGGQSTESSTSTDTGEYSNTQLTTVNTGVTPNADTNSDTWVEVDVPAPPSGTFQGCLATMKIQNSVGSTQDYDYELINQENSTTLYSQTNQTIGDVRSLNDNETLTTTDVSVGDTIRFNVSNGRLGTDSNRDWPLGYWELQINSFSEHTHDVTIPEHSHPPDPGVTEFPSETASGSDVIVGGSTVATDIGTGEFETTVDLSGDPAQGEWNTVEITSDTLGAMICSLGIEAYRQIGGE